MKSMSFPDPAVGVSLKSQHYDEILKRDLPIGWFELHPENYMNAGGENHRALSQIAERYPLSFHSVGLSLGRAEGPDLAYLERLAQLVKRYEPFQVSDHVAWTSSGGIFFNDLLPLPYTSASLNSFCNSVDLVQNRLGRRILIENPTQYSPLGESDRDETEFLNELARRSGCGLLLDLNNIYICANNLDFDAKSYLEAIDLSRVDEVHLAGHTESEWNGSRVLIDDHGSEVCSEVWALYADLLSCSGPVPTLIEWDTDVPALDRLLDEAAKAQACIDAIEPKAAKHAIAV
ncbi:DUF692 domain-containing protein [Denitrobaculum tricleocarpae]|uniref:DUF692 domain-containing protein n=1 Tax=Denitrobaculum tricleocarpae TaxID=2591009 RepID=A0A545TAV9_9PROT|nr:DUF692 domain-containing protein [Denitrobaculum tricleocarpae]TQV74349.1 DUF692 domain-containing protein [Denitrobaculum tricleocarpae]